MECSPALEINVQGVDQLINGVGGGLFGEIGEMGVTGGGLRRLVAQ